MQSDRASGPVDAHGGAAGITTHTEEEHDEEHEDHHHYPPPSIWPMTLAGGIAIAGMGLVTQFAVSIAGLVIMAYAIISWVQELRHEPHY